MVLYENIISSETLQLKERIDSLRPLPQETIHSLEDNLMLRYNQESNAIEGNSLTLIETKVLLEFGLTAKGKPFKDHLDIINHQKAIEFLMDVVKFSKNLSERDILDFHYLLLKGTNLTDQAGVYRKAPVAIAGSDHKTTSPFLIKQEMQELIDWHKQVKGKLNPIVVASILHTRFVRIHPFVDGNGRTARLLMNMELLQAGYPIAIIKASDRNEYYETLESVGKDNNFEQIIKFTEKCVVETGKFMLSIIDQNNEETIKKETKRKYR